MKEIITEFLEIRDSLSIVDRLVLTMQCVVIPSVLRQEVLDVLGSAHQGEAAMKQRAATAVYWPGLAQDISDYKKLCLVCAKLTPSQPHSPHIPPQIPTMPFESIVADYFDLYGHHYLVIGDRLSVV